jgi:hypothetical protein
MLFALKRLRLPIAVIGAVVFAALLALAAFSSPAQAHHSWKSYGKVLHWERTSNPFTLKLGDNVSSDWDDNLIQTSSDWTKETGSAADVLDTQVVPGSTNGTDCTPTEGRVEVCNAAYGENGWLGLAQVWVPDWRSGHISQGTTKINDSYFSQAPYNTTPAWKQLVMCQEVGHTFGLDHQNEKFNNANLGTCMDYTNDPDGGPDGASQTDPSNEHPNQHDYNQLATIYKHLDVTTTVGASAASKAASKIPSEINRGNLNSRAQWGRLIKTSPDGKLQVYERVVDGSKLITFVKKP